MMYKNIFFDLDGTLTDPAEGITNSVAYALRSFGIEITDNKVLYPFIGPPLIESFMKYYNFNADSAAEAVRVYREYFSATGIFENKLYDGIPELLFELKKSKRKVIMATSKPEVFAKQIAEHFKIDSYFDCITGSMLDGTRVAKAEVIEYAINKMGIKSRGDCIMVGDRMHDIIGAKKTDIKSVGVLYGYGCREEFTENGADYICDTVESLKHLLLQ